MRAKAGLGRIASAGAALVIPFIPKCPLCLPPLLAAAGIALPQGPAVEGIVAGAVVLWFTRVLATARWLPVRLAAATAAVAILGGRSMEVWWLGAGGSALMLGVVFWTRRRPRACEPGLCGAEDQPPTVP